MLEKKTSSSDARFVKNRSVRGEWLCTVCGQTLPKLRKEWGLIWNSELHGACVPCVHELRSAFGFRFSLDLDALLSLCNESLDAPASDSEPEDSNK